MRAQGILGVSLLVAPLAAAVTCPRPGPAFPVPSLSANDPSLAPVAASVRKKLNSLQLPNTTYWSVAFATTSEILFEQTHTAIVPGNGSTPNVTDNTVFRLASVSKVFTVLSMLQQAHNGSNTVSITDPVTKYLPELKSSTAMDWEGVTLGSLASQLSGVMRMYGQNDLAAPGVGSPEILAAAGLPTIMNSTGLVAPCGKSPLDPLCTREQLLGALSQNPPILATNSRSTYSDVAFVALGLALESMSGQSYGDLISEQILKPLGMNHTTTSAPTNRLAGAIPAIENQVWDWDLGLFTPTGGLYSSTSDLLRFGQAILSSKLLPQQVTDAWLKPVSYTSSGLNSAYGMPWEIVRTTKTTGDGRALDIITKEGDVPGYNSFLGLVPEFGLVFTIQIAGEQQGPYTQMLEAFVPTVLREMEDVIRRDVRTRYAGSYTATAAASNSTLALSVPAGEGVRVDSWTSEGQDVKDTLLTMMGGGATSKAGVELHLIPAGFYANATAKQGEVWYATLIQTEEEEEETAEVFADQCVTDIDTLRYLGQSILQFQFLFGDDGAVQSVDLPGYRASLQKVKSS